MRLGIGAWRPHAGPTTCQESHHDISNGHNAQRQRCVAGLDYVATDRKTRFVILRRERLLEDDMRVETRVIRRTNCSILAAQFAVIQAEKFSPAHVAASSMVSRPPTLRPARPTTATAQRHQRRNAAACDKAGAAVLVMSCPYQAPTTPRPRRTSPQSGPFPGNLEPFDPDVVFLERVADLARRQSEDARGLGLHPAGPFHCIDQALPFRQAETTRG